LNLLALTPQDTSQNEGRSEVTKRRYLSFGAESVDVNALSTQDVSLMKDVSLNLLTSSSRSEVRLQKFTTIACSMEPPLNFVLASAKQLASMESIFDLYTIYYRIDKSILTIIEASLIHTCIQSTVIGRCCHVTAGVVL